jgi:hypothetical protein
MQVCNREFFGYSAFLWQFSQPGKLLGAISGRRTILTFRLCVNFVENMGPYILKNLFVSTFSYENNYILYI